MAVSDISASEIVNTIKDVGQSIVNQSAPPPGKMGHLYVSIIGDKNNVRLSKFGTANKHASFEEINQLVEIALDSKEIKTRDKIDMLKGYQEITKQYQQKKKSWSFFLSWVPYIFGQAAQVDKAEALIKQKLNEFEPPEKDGPGKYISDGVVYQGIFKNKVLVEGTITEADGTVYEGTFRDNQLFGMGKMRSPDGTVHEGEFQNGRMHGKGSAKNASGERIYEGDYENGEIHGRGTAYFPEGKTIEGVFDRGIEKGCGTIVEPDKLFYSGDFINGGIFHGEGVLMIRGENPRTLKGTFVNGVLQGVGSIKYLDGALYEGEFKDGVLQGKGKVTFQGGMVYEGEFKDGVLQGKGTMTDSSKKIYEGQFYDGIFSESIDLGVLKEKLKMCNGKSYVGNFDDDFNGTGSMVAPDGAFYVGTFKKGVLEGFGSFSPVPDEVFEGYFKNGMLHGKGKHKSMSSGTVIYEGAFKYGKPQDLPQPPKVPKPTPPPLPKNPPPPIPPEFM